MDVHERQRHQKENLKPTVKSLHYITFWYKIKSGWGYKRKHSLSNRYEHFPSISQVSRTWDMWSWQPFWLDTLHSGEKKKEKPRTVRVLNCLKTSVLKNFWKSPKISLGYIGVLKQKFRHHLFYILYLKCLSSAKFFHFNSTVCLL